MPMHHPFQRTRTAIQVYNVLHITPQARFITRFQGHISLPISHPVRRLQSSAIVFRLERFDIRRDQQHSFLFYRKLVSTPRQCNMETHGDFCAPTSTGPSERRGMAAAHFAVSSRGLSISGQTTAWARRIGLHSGRGGRLKYSSDVSVRLRMAVADRASSPSQYCDNRLGGSSDLHSSTQSSLAPPSFSCWPVTRSTHSS